MLKQNKISVIFNAPYMSIFNAIELSFRDLKKIIYSNIYNSMEEVYNDVIKFLKSEQFNDTLLYNYRETINQYLLYIESNIGKNLNSLKIDK